MPVMPETQQLHTIPPLRMHAGLPQVFLIILPD